MKILVVNTVCGAGSTGRIACRLAREDLAAAGGGEIVFAYGRDELSDAAAVERAGIRAWKVGRPWEIALHGLLTRFFDRHGTGLCSHFATRALIRRAEAYDPDVLWLHNLHGYYLNFELLFAWIKSRPKMQVKWMLHDCWTFTGHCPHYTATGCTQYQTECRACPQRRDYPSSCLVSNARGNFRAKKRAFLGAPNVTLVIPSDWLAAQVRSGFLRDYPIVMRRHTVDTSVFRPTPGDVRVRLGLKAGERMILGVASQWDAKKGFPDMLALARLLSPAWRIVLVGLEPAQIAALPSNVTGLARTNSPQELAELYTAADWFFNPTHEDIYSMTNAEAAACGCRVVSYDTGGAPEAVVGYAKAVLLGEHTPEAAWAVMAQASSSRAGG